MLADARASLRGRSRAPAARTEPAAPSRETASALELLVLALSAGVPTLLLASYALDLAGLPIQAPTVVGLALLAAIASCAAAARGRRVVLDPGTLAGALIAAGIAFGYSLLITRPDFYPIATAVDTVHHYQYASAYYEGHSLISGDSRMAAYPFGGALPIAIAAWLTGLRPLTLLQPAASAFVALTVLAVYALVAELVGVPGRRVWAASLAVALLLVPADYALDQFVANFYLAQMMGQIWVVALVYWLVRLGRTWDPIYTVPMFGSAAALILSYPTWLPWFFLAIALVAADARHVDVRRRVRALLLFGVPTLALLALFLKDRLLRGLEFAREEGATTLPRVDRLGLLVIVLGGIGLVIALRNRRMRVLAFCAIAFGAQMAASYAGAVVGLSSFYAAHKLWYGLVYLLVALGGVGLGGLAAIRLSRAPDRWRRTPGRVPENAASPSPPPSAPSLPMVDKGLGGEGRSRPLPALLPYLLLTLLVLVPAAKVAVDNAGLRSGPIDRDVVRVAAWVREELPTPEIAYVTSQPLTRYWLRLGLLPRPTTNDEALRMLVSAQGFYDWLCDPAQPDTAIVVGSPSVDQPGGAVLYRSGDAAVVRRAAPTCVAQDIAAGPVLLGPDVTLTSVEVLDRRLTPGSAITVRARGSFARRMSRDYLLGVHLRDAAGRTIASADTRLEPPARAARQTGPRPFEIDLPLALDADTMPGRYSVEVFALALPTYELLPPGVVVDPLVVLDRSDVLPADAAIPGRKVGGVLGGRIELASVEAPSAARPGEPLEITLYWRQTAPIGERYTRFVHVAGADGRPVAQHDAEPASGRLPTTLWRGGEIVRDVVRVGLLSDLRPGSYRLLAGMYLPSTNARLPVAGGGDVVELGTIEVGGVP